MPKPKVGDRVDVMGEEDRNPGIVRLAGGSSGLYMIEFPQFGQFGRWLWVTREQIEKATGSAEGEDDA